MFQSRYALTITLAIVCVGTAAGQPATDQPNPLKTPQEKGSYGIGLQIGQQLRSGGIEPSMISLEALFAGIQDSLSGKEPRLEEAELTQALQQVDAMLRNKVALRMKSVREKNRREGPKHMQRFKGMEGVKALPGGVLYRVIKPGNGPSPKQTDTVRTHYRGRLVDGTEFDSSYKRGEPTAFPVNGVIRGWTAALLKMKVGGHWQIVIPPEMAYGAEGSPPFIGPDAVLIFDLELLGIQPASANP